MGKQENSEVDPEYEYWTAIGCKCNIIVDCFFCKKIFGEIGMGMVQRTVKSEFGKEVVKAEKIRELIRRFLEPAGTPRTQKRHIQKNKHTIK